MTVQMEWVAGARVTHDRIPSHLLQNVLEVPESIPHEDVVVIRPSLNHCAIDATCRHGYGVQRNHRIVSTMNTSGRIPTGARYSYALNRFHGLTFVLL